MLQQTRVAAALGFYDRFMKRFPTVESLAKASESDVLAHWAGLGYYSRARNVHRAAQSVVAAHGAIFPATYETLIALPGIGEYTAAAIGSIAFDLPHAAVDGNLLRVLARLDNDPSDVGSSRTRARFTQRAQEILDPLSPGDFNQAMMELGATICLPRSPRCGECPVHSYCEGFAAGRQAELPVKGGKQARVDVEVTSLVVRSLDRILLTQRPPDAGQMPGFWELPDDGVLPSANARHSVGIVRHTITHHHYRYDICVAEWSGEVSPPLAWKEWDQLRDVLLTTAAKKALRLVTSKGRQADRIVV